jgi:histidinol dehydrogenase
MKIIVNPLQEALPELLQRPVMDHAALQTVVQGVLDAVRTGGDKAVASYTKQFDGVTIDDLQVSEAAINEATPVSYTHLRAHETHH